MESSRHRQIEKGKMSHEEHRATTRRGSRIKEEGKEDWRQAEVHVNIKPFHHPPLALLEHNSTRRRGRQPKQKCMKSRSPKKKGKQKEEGVLNWRQAEIDQHTIQSQKETFGKERENERKKTREREREWKKDRKREWERKEEEKGRESHN